MCILMQLWSWCSFKIRHPTRPSYSSPEGSFQNPPPGHKQSLDHPCASYSSQTPCPFDLSCELIPCHLVCWGPRWGPGGRRRGCASGWSHSGGPAGWREASPAGSGRLPPGSLRAGGAPSAAPQPCHSLEVTKERRVYSAPEKGASLRPASCLQQRTWSNWSLRPFGAQKDEPRPEHHPLFYHTIAFVRL